jgi:hypothetical protein
MSNNTLFKYREVIVTSKENVEEPGFMVKSDGGYSAFVKFNDRIKLRNITIADLYKHPKIWSVQVL